MTNDWKQYEGKVIDGAFPLQQFLGGSDCTAVFLTQFGSPQSQKAVIKFVPADTKADLQLSLWRRATQLTHPNLLRLFNVGRSRLANMDLLYVVMEYADEDLSQILPQRPLTASEVREMLGHVLELLAYLHARGLVHSRVKPSNILASGDQLKLSSDCLFPVGELRKSSREPDAYDAPEVSTSPLSPLADVWSLGVTIVEAFTQHAPGVQPGSQSDPAVPDSLPQPFLEIARRALCRDPKRRWNVAEIAARLNPAALAAAAAASVSPLAVPLSPVPAVPAARLQTPNYVPPAPSAQSSVPQAANPPKQAIVLPNYVIPLAVAALIIAAIFTLPKILSHRPESSSSASNAAAQPASQPKVVGRPVHREAPASPKPSAQPLAQNALKTTAEKNPAEVAQRTPVAAPAPASLRTDNFPSANTQKTSAASPGSGEVLEEILPDVSEKARGTIQGVVRVGVRVHVDPTGNVSLAELDSPGPSKYFADLALKAARRWSFTSPEVDGHSVPSEWLIRFDFMPSGTKAVPRQTAP